jgi:hypothetical protein
MYHTKAKNKSTLEISTLWYRNHDQVLHNVTTCDVVTILAVLNFQGAHFAGLLDLQNILSADTGISRRTEGLITWSVRQSVLYHRVWYKLLLCSVRCLSWLVSVNVPSAWAFNIRYNPGHNRFSKHMKFNSRHIFVRRKTKNQSEASQYINQGAEITCQMDVVQFYEYVKTRAEVFHFGPISVPF